MCLLRRLFRGCGGRAFFIGMSSPDTGVLVKPLDKSLRQALGPRYVFARLKSFVRRSGSCRGGSSRSGEDLGILLGELKGSRPVFRGQCVGKASQALIPCRRRGCL